MPAYLSPADDYIRRMYAGQLPPGHDQPALVGDHHQLGPVARRQLGEDPADVRLGGGRAEAQPAGDLGVGQALGDQRQHLDARAAVSRSSVRAARPAVPGRRGELGDQPPGDRGASSASPAAHHPDRRRSSSVRRGVLEQEAAGAGPQRRVDVLVQVEGGQHERPGRRSVAGSAAIRRVASMPSSPGIRTSISTTSGRCRRASATACSAGRRPRRPPRGRAPAPSSTRNPSRTSAWSSATATRIVTSSPVRSAAARPAPASRRRRPARPPACRLHGRTRSRIPTSPCPGGPSGRGGSARRAVVDDLDLPAGPRRGARRPAPGRARVLAQRVGQRLLHAPGRPSGRSSGGSPAGRRAGPPRPSARPPATLPTRSSSAASPGGSGLAQHPEHLTHLPHRLAGWPPRSRPARRGRRPGRPASRRQPPGARTAPRSPPRLWPRTSCRSRAIRSRSSAATRRACASTRARRSRTSWAVTADRHQPRPRVARRRRARPGGGR